MKDLNAGKGGDSHLHFAKRRISNGPFAVKYSESTAVPISEGTTIGLEASTQRGSSAHGTCTRAKNSEKSGRKLQNALRCEPCVAGVDSTGNCAAMMLDLEPGLIVKKEETLRVAHGSNHVGHSTYTIKYMELERSVEAVSGSSCHRLLDPRQPRHQRLGQVCSTLFVCYPHFAGFREKHQKH
ncbi:hypothetical protein CTAM01_14800 [Colletotrichum tamarilloi]|uniref:Uncharacterized protein n=1 Tax=Colletotrichum tamarilloi TaxID=1209934 RepID=A0ABQ9QN54_9PEZI|nr:uncharacterized protein CTAM01_14800 [Colletotrichum tamarilloi]KAK1479145.1 hypothetical protein CTAM01_14800 [Colletotrichum tamarilloi]